MRTYTILTVAIAALAAGGLGVWLLRRGPDANGIPAQAGVAGARAPTAVAGTGISTSVAGDGTSDPASARAPVPAPPDPTALRAAAVREFVRDLRARAEIALDIAKAREASGGAPVDSEVGATTEEEQEFEARYAGKDEKALRSAFELASEVLEWQRGGTFAYGDEKFAPEALALLEREVAWLKERALGGGR